MQIVHICFSRVLATPNVRELVPIRVLLRELGSVACPLTPTSNIPQSLSGFSRWHDHRQTMVGSVHFCLRVRHMHP